MSALTYNYTCEIAKLPWQRLARNFSTNNIQATISAFWLVKSMLISPKSVQKREIECKTGKLKWLTATLSWDKQNGGQKLNEDWNSSFKSQYNYLITKQSAKLNNNY